MIDYVEYCPLAPDAGEILYPGERAARVRQHRLSHGVDIDSETWRHLQDIARERGIRVPGGV